MTVLGLIGSVAEQIDAPKGLWEWLLRLLSGAIPTYVLAIIVFTILLKVVLSPLDFFQRYKMKKNERLTKKIQPEMDKLARQYADDKTTLQQKQFQLQKQAGFSYFSACIPLILTMVVFFTFFAGMRNISQYEEFSQYVARYDIYVDRYTKLTGLNINGTAALDDEENAIVPSSDYDTLLEEWGNQAQGDALSAYNEYSSHADFSAFYADYLNRAQVRNFVVANSILQVKDSLGADFDIAYIYTLSPTDADAVAYLSGLKANIALNDTEGILSINTFEDFKQLRDDLSHYDTLAGSYLPAILSVAENAAASEVYNDYKSKKPGFLWIKSIWISDVPWKDAVPAYSAFRSSTSAYMVNNKGGLTASDLNEVQKKETYEKVMAKVLSDKSLSGTNGYLILAVLAVGLSFLSQLISTRQQKRAGTSVTSNTSFKMMMYIMPLMMGVFAVISTAAFAVYMITNSIMTLLINLLCSFIVKQIHKKEDKEAFNADGVIRYGRPDPNDKK